MRKLKKKKRAKVKHTEESVFKLLEKKYAGTDWVVLPQVPDATGMSKCRTADAVAMSLWPSRGLELHGFEIKVSRSDWLQELKNPKKAESIARYCDKWWVLVSDKNIVKDGELPLNWGMMYVTSIGLRVKKQAELSETIPIDRKFLAGLLRASDKYRKKKVREETSDAKIRKDLDDSFSKGFKAGEASCRRQYEFEKDNHQDLKDFVKEFESLSGLKIEEYDWRYRRHGNQLGKQVKALREFNRTSEHLVSVKQDLENLTSNIATLIDMVNTSDEETS